ncbi:hypothetical protein BCR41DRAFT_366503 [Lobosporangium transversale]|uniref:Uncharacterized protein n=1 Tax=Lobosporangium transversale TaxID=64571 RepID=A0A1Y2H2K7_9FUNG|nr:hypothetical protein BCR41DRAFT_366503 [Lobosporangium transversale]ORZ28778.1 hypothetical protein BCR41DRAFT_366503 [Lobosporangium transversale]|eukprot:XP_021886451.1 hypothetical protein BCR41DRAFT_366503 [Lobosporangium transversale]
MTSNSDLDFSFEEKKYNDMSDVEQQEEDNDIYYSEERENNISYNEKDEENNTSYNEEGEDCGDNLYAGSMSEGVEDEVEAEYWSDEDNDGCRSPVSLHTSSGAF